MYKPLHKLSALVLVCCAFLGSSDAWGQVLVKSGSTKLESFNSMGNAATATLPDGWKVAKSTSVRTVAPFAEAVTATERAGGARLASNAANGIYNFAAADGDQAVGFLSSGSATKSGNLYAHFRNEDAVSINGLTISYAVEKYRAGTNPAGYTMQLYYSLDGSNWTSAGNDFKVSFAPDAETAGYDVVPGEVTSVEQKKLAVEIPAGADFYLAWNYSVTDNSTTTYSQALAVDDVAVVFGSQDASNVVTFTQDFNLSDANAANLPEGWKADKLTIVRTVGTYADAVSVTEREGGANLSTSAANGIYSFTSSEDAADRAIGFLSSSNGTKSGNLYGFFENNEGLEEIEVSFSAEKYRKGSRTEGFSIQLYYSLDGSNWTSAGDDFKLSFAGDDSNSGYEEVPSVVQSVEKKELALEVPAGAGFYLAWNYSVTEGTYTSNAQALAIDDIVVSYSSSGIATPAITVPNSVAFGDIAVGSTAITSYELASRNISSPVTIAITGAFEISKSENAGFAKELIYSAEELANTQTVFVRVAPVEAGTLEGTITHSGAGFNTAVVDVTATVVSPFAQNFNSCGTSLPGGWSQYSVTGAQTWGCTTFGRENEAGAGTNGVQINGYSGGARENEDWLISPALNLSSFENIPILSFWSRTAFRGPGLKLMVSTDYDGTSAPATATWTEVEGFFPSEASDVWTQSLIDLSAYKGAGVYVAFVYNSVAETNGAARWTIDEFAVEDVENILISSDIAIDFGLVEVPNTSEARTFTFKALGYPEGVTLATTNSSFELSKEGLNFSSSISYTSEEAGAQNTVYVRFKPAATVFRETGAIAFTSAGFTEERGTLTGSSLPKNTTLDIATWNLEWFGSSEGPSDNELQYANAKKVLQTLDADIIAMQEIANDELMEQLINELPGYAFVKSEVYSYSQRSGSGTLPPQKLYIVYKEETVSVKSEKVLLNSLYGELLANTTVLPNYPGTGTDASNDDGFWASGRLPYMVEVEATINGVTQRLHLLNLHTRANSGTNTRPYEQRKYDLQVLKDSLDAYYPNVNLVLLGDVNDDVDVSVVNNLPSTLESFVIDPDFKALTYDLSTTGAYTYSGGSYQSFLDHVIVSKSLVDEYIPESITIENQFLSSITNYRTTTSDHIPVSARFDFSVTPVLTFSAASGTATEGAGALAVNMTLSEAQAKPHTVYLTIKDDATATAVDYTTAPAASENTIVVTVPAYATSVSFDVTPLDDQIVEPTEYVTFYINGVSTDLGIGATRSFALAIRENDIPNGINNGQSKAFMLYPNPSNGSQVYLSMPEHVSPLQTISLDVLSAQGTPLYNLTGSQETVQQQLNNKLNGMKNGMYIIRVEAGREVYQTRLVKN